MTCRIGTFLKFLSVVLSTTMISESMTTGNVSLAQRLLSFEQGPSFEQKLRRKVSVTWQGQELAVALHRLTSVGQIPLWLDRRVDRQQKVTARVVDLSLSEVLEKISQQQSLSFTQLKNVVYIGPPQTAHELTTLIQQARSQLNEFPRRARKRWLREEAINWPRLSEPRALVESWLRDTNIQLIGGERIAHDLWPEQSLPPLALVDRVVLLLAGFDLTCEFGSEGRSCEVVAITRPLKQARLEGVMKTEGKKGRKKTNGRSSQRFTLRLENQPLGRVLDQLALQLGLAIVWPSETREARGQLVSCDVKNVGLDELLRNVLGSARLQCQREGKRITIEGKLP